MRAVRITRAQRDAAIEGGRCLCVLDFARIGGMRVALKAYETRGEALRAFSRQRRASEQGLGPVTIAVGAANVLEVRGAGSRAFGYLSEQAAEHRGGVREIEALRKRLRRRGLPHLDLRACNVGRVGGRLVRIDFDDASSDQ